MPRIKSRITITLNEKLLKNIDRLVDGSSIKSRSHAIEFLLSKNFHQEKIRTAVILAGGKGIKVKGGSASMSKVLMPYKRRLFIEHVLDWLKKEEIEEVVISAGDLSDEIKRKIGDGSKFGVSIYYLSSDSGNAKILKHLEKIVSGTFLMLNGDVLCDTDLDEIFEFHGKSGGLCTIGMVSVKEPHAFGTIKLKGNRIVDFIEKPKKGEEESYLINAGLYIMEPEICAMASSGCISLEKDLFPDLAKKGKIFGYYLEGKWLHLDSAK